MSQRDEEIRRLEAAIAAQELLRSTLGDAVVDVTVSALRAKLEASQAHHPREVSTARGGASVDELLGHMQRYIPRELAEKMRVLGRIEGERRRVTVLFADLSGFTSLSESLDPEELTSLVNDALHELASAVYQYEGHIDKFIGDAVMAVFGAPIAHEDDPERALRAALAMRERLENFSRRWKERLGQTLSLHIGINTGEVIAGNVGSDLRLAYTVMGDTVNTAARLQDAADSGQIFVSRETWQLTHEAFDFAALEPLTVKGKREPLFAYELLRARLLPTKTRGLHGLAQVFVGREEDLSTLLDIAHELQEGRGSIVTLSGEAGIGKSRLLAEWRLRLGESVRWVEGRCYAHTESLPFGPFLDLIRRKAGITDEHSDAEARVRLHAALERSFPGDTEAQAIFTSLLALRTSPENAATLASHSAQELRQRLFAFIERYFTGLARERPTLLIFEDLHWADTSTLEVLERLLSVTERVPLTVVCTARVLREGPPARLLAHLEARGRRHVSRSLGPLSHAHSAEMVEQLLSTPALPEALRALVSLRAEGNPFFVEELLRSLIERGALVRGEGGWTVTPLLQTLKVPGTLQGVLMARLDCLPAETKWLAQQASVIGRVFLYRVLMHMAEPMVSADADLGHLEREDLIRERARDPELEYMFKHALTQDVAYQSLLAPRRKELHRKVGEALETLFSGRVDEFRSVIGDHYLRGEAWKQATEHLLVAGDGASRLYANAEARVHYTKALEALAHLPDTEEHRRLRVDTTLRLVSVSFVAVPPEQNLQRLAGVEALALGLRTPEGRPEQQRLARVHYWMGRLHLYRNALAEAASYFQRVLEEGRDLGDAELFAIPSFMMGRVKVLQGHFEQARCLLAQALEPLERAADQMNWIWTLAFHGLALAALGQPRTGAAQLERALARARELNTLTGVAICQLLQSLLSVSCRDWTRMREASRACVTAAEQSGDRVYAYGGYSLLAWAQGHLGQHEEAARSVTRSRQLAETLGGQIALGDWYAAGEAEIAFLAGRLPEAEALARRVAEQGRASGGLFAEAVSERVLGQALAARGDWRNAEPHFQTSLECFERGQARLEEAHTRVIWARLLTERGAGMAARAHLTRAIAIYEESGLEGELTRARDLLGGCTPEIASEDPEKVSKNSSDATRLRGPGGEH